MYVSMYLFYVVDAIDIKKIEEKINIFVFYDFFPIFTDFFTIFTIFYGFFPSPIISQ